MCLLRELVEGLAKRGCLHREGDRRGVGGGLQSEVHLLIGLRVGEFIDLSERLLDGEVLEI